MKNFFALLLYRLLFLCLLPVILITLLIRSSNNSAYRQRLLERLGWLSMPLKKHGIIIHAASVGEVIAVTPFIEQVLKTYPNTAVTVTTFTPTGSEQVIKNFVDRVQHCYFPLDCFLSTWLFLKKLQPQAMVLMETELWPNIIQQTQASNCKLLLINARLSKNSMMKYQKLSWLIKPALNNFAQILCQSQENKEHFLTLGADEPRCQLTGNLKYDISITDNILNKSQELQQYLDGTRPYWVAASTHPGDEQIILTAFKKLQITHPQLLLVLVPRHPERFESVFQLCQQAGFNVQKRSEKQPISVDNQIWLLDTLGELMATYHLATIVTMGGSFSEIGGHNPLEPALFKKPIITGPNMSNFNEVLSNLKHEHAVIQLKSNSNPEDSLAEEVDRLLHDKIAAQEFGENAYQVVLRNQGATDKSIAVLSTLITPSTAAS